MNPEKYVEEWPFGLYLGVWGYHFYLLFGGVGRIEGFRVEEFRVRGLGVQGSGFRSLRGVGFQMV